MLQGQPQFMVFLTAHRAIIICMRKFIRTIRAYGRFVVDHHDRLLGYEGG
jgi:hypothetical protein